MHNESVMINICAVVLDRICTAIEKRKLLVIRYTWFNVCINHIHINTKQIQSDLIFKKKYFEHNNSELFLYILQFRSINIICFGIHRLRNLNGASSIQKQISIAINRNSFCLKTQLCVKSQCVLRFNAKYVV